MALAQAPDGWVPFECAEPVAFETPGAAREATEPILESDQEVIPGESDRHVGVVAVVIFLALFAVANVPPGAAPLRDRGI